MAEKYYFDTCIWRDFYENRLSKSGRPLGKYAADLFMKIIKKKDLILFSEALVWELRRDYDERDIYDMLNFLFVNGVLVRVDTTREEYLEAKRLSKEKNLPFIDCLYAIQARNYGALMVSQDRHFLENLSGVVNTARPEQIS